PRNQDSISKTLVYLSIKLRVGRGHSPALRNGGLVGCVLHYGLSVMGKGTCYEFIGSFTKCGLRDPGGKGVSQNKLAKAECGTNNQDCFCRGNLRKQKRQTIRIW